ncbi:MAG: SbmA/BacA-like family transporter, partial [Chloroflexia bacterium]
VLRGIPSNLRDAWTLARPYFSSEEKWSARLLLAAIVALNLGLVALEVVLSYWNKEFFDSLQDKNWDSFIALLFFFRIDDSGFMPGFTAVAVIYIAVAVYRRYLNQWLQIRWRRWMTTRFLDGYFSDRAFYRIALLGAAGNGNGAAEGTDNPDQRIADDVRDFVADTLALSLDLLSNVVTLFSFIVILWNLSGPVTLLGVTIPGYMVFVALLYAAVGTTLTHLVGRPLAALNFRQQRVEADFRFSLARLRENAEGIALQGGEAQEKLALSGRFAALAANWWAIMQRTKLLNAFVAGYGQVASVFPIVVAAPRYFSGELPLGGLTQTAGAFGQVQSAMSWFVTSYASLASWQATVGRLATFERAIAAARAGTQQGLVHAT